MRPLEIAIALVGALIMSMSLIVISIMLPTVCVAQCLCPLAAACLPPSHYLPPTN
jgi:hypothetical protein